MSKPIHILITVTEDGKSVAYEKWVSEEEAREILLYDKPNPKRYGPQA
jgi:hypothetical protein